MAPLTIGCTLTRATTGHESVNSHLQRCHLPECVSVRGRDKASRIIKMSPSCEGMNQSISLHCMRVEFLL